LVRRGRPRASQGLVLGLASGTGFAIVENCAYVLAEPDWRVAVARALSTSIVHSTSTALIVFVVCQLFKHEHHHRGAAIGVAASGVMLRRVAVRLILRAIAPGAGRATVAIGLVSVLVSLTFLIGFLFVWFTMGALQEELQAERSELKSGSRQS
jgi:RsiW-degrading membrane proteinase PrsW (M82 family)